MGDGTALIGIDWGTTSFRAYRIAADGAVLEAKSAPAGILKVADGDFEAVFEREIGAWLQPGLPVLASGMIGSRQGWLEVPYCPCPAGSTEIANTLLPHPTHPELRFVPGLSLMGADGVPDVIRGEETQILGAIGDAPSCLAVLPGTHSKWVLIEAGQIVWFATFMTGELFGVLKEHSILGRLMQGDRADEAAFHRGLGYARESQGGLLKQLFSARTLGLFERLPAEGTASYLSGLLIGHEIEGALACLDHRPSEVILIGESALTASYVTALEASGLHALQAPSDAGARGQFLIARAAGLIA